MKKMSKKEKREILIIISSFFVGSIVTLLICNSIPIGRTTVIKNGTTIYDKTSLKSSIEKVYDAVVSIETYSGVKKDSSGTGFIYKIDNKYAYVLTNEHVIVGNYIEIENSNDETFEGVLLGKDQYLDLAVLKIDSKYAHQEAILGSSESLNIGDSIFIVGSPISKNYKGSVTSGIVSGKDRIVQTNISDQTSSNWLMDVVQVDASMNPGNSGGPLLNVNGEVVGICTMKLMENDIEGMGFAIPIDYATKYLDNLEKGKNIEWPELGIGMVNLDNISKLEEYNISIPNDLRTGIAIISIKNKSGAENASLKVGDIITEIDNIKIKDTTYLKYAIYKHKVGDMIEIKYLRNGKENIVKVRLNSSSN